MYIVYSFLACVVQGLIEDMEAKAADKSKLQSLTQSLTSDLPPESEEKAMLLAQMEELNSKWDKMEGELTSVSA